MFDIRKEIRIGSRVVFTVTEKTGEVYKIDEGGVFVFVDGTYGGDKGYWQWSQLMIRRPRLERRFPRPFRFPRLGPTHICFCEKGQLKVDIRHVKVICKMCKEPIGEQSYPRRIKQATTRWYNAYKAFLRRQNLSKSLSRRAKVPRRKGGSRKAHHLPRARRKTRH